MLVLSGVNLTKPQPRCNRQPLPMRQKQLAFPEETSSEWTLPGAGHCETIALSCPCHWGWLPAGGSKLPQASNPRRRVNGGS